MGVKGSPLGDYLRARRAVVSPEEAGVTSHTRRRVPGLRRDEVARAAGISQEYYLRLEQGRDRTPSDQVLRALGRALMLDEAAITYMLLLANAEPVDLPAQEAAVSMDNLAAILNAWPNTPAYIIDSRHTVVLSNAMARAVVPHALEPGVNIAEAVFTLPEVRALPTWDQLASRTVRRLRYYGHPFDPRLHELAARLSEQDPVFRTLWERQDVDPYYDGDVRPQVKGYGQIVLRHQTLVVPGTPGYLLCVYHAEPGTPSAEAIVHLAARTSSTTAEAHRH
ncbi:helix-turn-helix domain-containing protein [Promicromonospora sp. NPDC052451]|uniref:helix-turn-helix domain-containing protein n=1 Tax=unclassified Promicromonospora TaxID=2647929 RepID=UPI0037C63F43